VKRPRQGKVGLHADHARLLLGSARPAAPVPYRGRPGRNLLERGSWSRYHPSGRLEPAHGRPGRRGVPDIVHGTDQVGADRCAAGTYCHFVAERRDSRSPEPQSEPISPPLIVDGPELIRDSRC
jgi:hypothetical protein